MTRNVPQPKSARRAANSLRLESLESRRLLAVAALQSELLRDDNGSPGELIADNTLVTGESFFLRVTAQEFDPQRFGMPIVGVDIAWDADFLDVIAEDFRLESVITRDLPVLQTGELHQEDGTIRGLNGTSLSALGAGRPIGNARPETFALIRMQAGTQPGIAQLSLEKGQTKTVLAPTSLLGERHLRFDSEMITIIAAETPPVVPEETSESSTDKITVNQEIASEPSSEQIETTTTEPEIAEPLPIAKTEATAAAIEQAAAKELAPIVPVHTIPVTSIPVQSLPTVAIEPSILPTAASDAVPVPAEEPVAGKSGDGDSDTAAAVDAALTFDVNGDGVFDFADFGPINLRAAMAKTPQVTHADATQSIDEPIIKPANATHDFLHSCVAIPAIADVDATEAWLDAFAVAWLSDSDSRARRREDAKLF